MRARGKEGGKVVDRWVGVGRKEEKSRVEEGELGGRGGIRTREEKGTGTGGLLTSCAKHKLFFGKLE